MCCNNWTVNYRIRQSFNESQIVIVCNNSTQSTLQRHPTHTHTHTHTHTSHNWILAVLEVHYYVHVRVVFYLQISYYYWFMDEQDIALCDHVVYMYLLVYVVRVSNTGITGNTGIILGLCSATCFFQLVICFHNSTQPLVLVYKVVLYQ